ncbi:UrcA family protein [Henriciella sp.]|uniref:UrcA family protein n=1 Tax=Henriciella sp. TaxID=1968823 RepID=UPI002638FF46|nr:UrcA family protein [Henriciella sp.]
MKIIKSLALAAVLCTSAFAVAITADAALPAEDFSFNYNPSLLASMDGRADIRRDLHLEARNFCRRTMRTNFALRQERRCRQAVINDTVRQLSDRYPTLGERLVSADSSYDMSEHRAGRPQR